MTLRWLKHGMIGLVALAAVQCGSTSAGDENPGASPRCQDVALRDAATALQEPSAAIKNQWQAYCDAVGTDLGLDTSIPAPGNACGVVQARIQASIAKGVTVSMSVSGATCQGQDAVLEAQCQGACAGQLGCEQASCEAGKSATACQTDGGCLSYCTGKLACDPTGLLVPACHALGSARMTCSGTPVVNVVGDEELAQALQKHGAEYAAVLTLSEEFDELIDSVPCAQLGEQKTTDAVFACYSLDKARIAGKVIAIGY
jgi:hypothetical protein